jgi:hypothetical protein
MMKKMPPFSLLYIYTIPYALFLLPAINTAHPAVNVAEQPAT